MKFVIPQNYKFKNKILGLIDYPTAVINVIWCLVIYFILRNINLGISFKIFIFSSLCFPVLLLTVVGFNNESPIYSVRYIVRYLKRPKVYLFCKFDE